MTSIFIALASFVATARERLSREQGASAVEYGMLVALIAAVVVTSVVALGPKIAAAFDKIVNALTGAGV